MFQNRGIFCKGSFELVVQQLVANIYGLNTSSDNFQNAMHCYLTQPLFCTVGPLNVVLPLNWGKKMCVLLPASPPPLPPSLK